MKIHHDRHVTKLFFSRETVIESPSTTRVKTLQETKEELLDLLPRMKGTSEELSRVESCVNTLEALYSPPQTLEFFNLVQEGSWQLLFSTRLQGGPRLNFRFKELVQRVHPNQLQGDIVNTAQWDLRSEESDDSNGGWNCYGTFSATCDYHIHHGARMTMQLRDHKIELLPGSKVPQDLQALVGLIHRSIPAEMFDPSNHSMDTTYMDAEFRIVRMTGATHEGVRNIFMRSSGFAINPVSE
jgi:PAP_fibrillin